MHKHVVIKIDMCGMLQYDANRYKQGVIPIK